MMKEVVKLNHPKLVQLCLECTRPSCNGGKCMKYKEEEKKIINPRRCIGCGEMFFPNTKPQKYCSRACGDRHLKARPGQ